MAELRFLHPFLLFPTFSIWFAAVSLKSQELYLLVFLNRYVEHIALDNSYLDIGKICFIFFTSLLVVLMRCSPPSYGYTSQDFVQHWKFLFVPMVGMAWVCSGSGFGFLAILKFIVFVGVVGFYWMVTTDGIHINVPQIESIRVFYAEKRTALLVAVLFFFSIVVFLQDSMYGLSLLLESVAMVPQLAMLYSNGERDETGMFEWFPDGLIQVPLPIFMVSIYRYIYILHFIYRNATEDSYHFQPLIHLTTLLQSVINAPIIYL